MLITERIGSEQETREAWLKSFLSGEIDLADEHLPAFCDSSPEADLLDALEGRGKKARQAQEEIGDLAFAVLKGAFTKGGFSLQEQSPDLLIKLLSLLESLPTSNPASAAVELEKWRQLDFLKEFPDEDQHAHRLVLRALATQLSYATKLSAEFDRPGVLSEMLLNLDHPDNGISHFWVLMALDRDRALSEIHRPLKIIADAGVAPHMFLLGLLDPLGNSKQSWGKFLAALDSHSLKFISEALREILRYASFTQASRALESHLANIASGELS